MQNSKYKLHMACCTYHRTNLLLLATKQEPYRKAYLLTKNIEEFSGKSSGEWASMQRKKKKRDKTERVTGLGRRTRERR